MGKGSPSAFSSAECLSTHRTAWAKSTLLWARLSTFHQRFHRQIFEVAKIAEDNKMRRQFQPAVSFSPTLLSHDWSTRSSILHISLVVRLCFVAWSQTTLSRSSKITFTGALPRWARMSMGARFLPWRCCLELERLIIILTGRRCPDFIITSI